MRDSYKTLLREGEGELVEKKSRFIATTMPISSEQEALDFIEFIKKKYWNASHNCTAYVLGESHELQRFSDDGEPQGTAGKPILDVLLGEDIHNAVIVVTRYFGGTLLGTGGLVRAYSKSAQEGLKQSTIIEKQLGQHMIVHTDYSGIGKIQYIAAQQNVNILNSEYTDVVKVEVLCAVKQTEIFKKSIMEAFNGQVNMEEIGTTYFSVVEKEVLLFEHA